MMMVKEEVGYESFKLFLKTISKPIRNAVINDSMFFMFGDYNNQASCFRAFLK